MRIWLDDERRAPDGWLHVKTAPECMSAIAENMGIVEAISLDHDLGPNEAGTGYHVCLWLEEQCFTNTNFILPSCMMVHSQNPVGAAKMKAVLKALKARVDDR